MDVGENLDWIAYGMLDAADASDLRPAAGDRSEDPAAGLRCRAMLLTAGTPAEVLEGLWRRLRAQATRLYGNSRRHSTSSDGGRFGAAALRVENLSKHFGGARVLR